MTYHLPTSRPPRNVQTDMPPNRGPVTVAVDQYFAAPGPGLQSGRAPESDSQEVSTPLIYNSFSGSDIQCMMWMEKPRWDETMFRGKDRDWGTWDAGYKIFAELQTLTVSSTRNVFPVRRLGESHSYQYTRGARTIAGTMVFSMLNRDVMSEFYRFASGEIVEDAPFFVDQIPPFSIFIHGASEYGGVTNAALIDVTLVNFGQTVSVDDIFMESTYTYVAKHWFPFIEDTQAFIRRRAAFSKTKSVPMSAEWVPPALYDRWNKFDDDTKTIMMALERSYPGIFFELDRGHQFDELAGQANQVHRALTYVPPSL